MTNRPRSRDRYTLGDVEATFARLEIKRDRYGRYATRRLIALPDLLNESTVVC